MFTLTIAGAAQPFIDIKTFRAAHHLPEQFGVALFEPKDYTGLGRIDRAGNALNEVRQAALNAIPQQMPLRSWLSYLPTVTAAFEDKLRAVNPRIGLRDVEVEFAAAGFQDMCSTLIFALMRAHTEKLPLQTLSFAEVYVEWLNSTVRVSQTVHPYQHNAATWQVQTVSYAYGRAGLIVKTDAETFYVADAALGCPAESFMFTLLAQVAGKIVESIEAVEDAR